MKFKLLVFLFLVNFIFCQQNSCPIWKCAEQSEKLEGYCYFDKDNYILVGPHCNTNSENQCNLMEYYKGYNAQRCQTSYRRSAEFIPGDLYNSYCFNMDWIDYMNCDKYCKLFHICSEDQIKSNSTQKCQHKWSCDYEALKQDFSDNEGLQDWSPCQQDSQCRSNQCKCTPSTDGLGRCVTSVREHRYKDFFKMVCEKRNQEDWYVNVCYYFIIVSMGHFLFAIEANQAQLPCLTLFNDFKDLMEIDLEKYH